ncbi:MAG: acyl carrier protein [Thermoanaerobaculales bacterium]
MRELAEEILAEVRRTLRDELEFPSPVEPHHDLRADLALGSMGALVLAVALEDRFRVKLDDEDAAAVRTVADLVALVERRVEACRTAGARAPDSSEAGA